VFVAREWTSIGPDSAQYEMTRFEREVVNAGFARIAGIDEVGRGPLAGPIVAGAVVLRCGIPGLNDSKQLTEHQRESLYSLIMDGTHAVGIGKVESDEIDRIGIQRANYRAMLEAVQALSPPPDFLLVDGFEIKGYAGPQKRIIKGDAKSVSIAAASIVAKVTRDRIMKELAVEYPEYGFDRHKGYGTAAHLDALKRLGPTPCHRRSFSPIAKTPSTGELL
jgi:ribonuclease HII